MKLYFDPLSPASRTVTFFLHDQAIAFDEHLIDLSRGGQFVEEFARLNPNRQVPVLEDGGFILTESSAILRYLGQKTARAYPTEVRDRARVDEAMDWFSTHFHTFFGVLTVYPQFLPKVAVLGAEGIKPLAQAGVTKYFDVLDQRFADGRSFVCGTNVTLADYTGLVYASLGEATRFDYSAWPNVRRWMQRMKQRPGYAAAFGSWDQAFGLVRSQAA